MAEQNRKFGDYFSAVKDWLSDFWESVKPSLKQIKELLGFFGTAVGALVLIYVLLLAVFFIGPRRAYGAEGVSNAKFGGLIFKTRYQDAVRIPTPIFAQMDNETRVLNIVLEDPASAKFSFLFKISPGDYRSWKEKVKDGRGTAMFTSSGRAYFYAGDRPFQKIDTITIIIDTGPNNWLDNYQKLIEENFKSCQMGLSPKGDPDMVCPPLWIGGRINRIERSTASPDLPRSHVFPHLDYADIYIEVTGVSKTRPKN
jgi:hypothetical protein